MVKKLRQMADKQTADKQAADKQNAPRAGLLDGPLAGQVKDSAQQIWLAGLGAFARAQAEGTKVFETLVKEGTTLQKKTQSAAEDKISEVTSKMSSLAGDVQAKAGQQWDKLESIFEQRTAKALKKLGVPSANDVDALMARIDELSARVAKLSKAAPAKAGLIKRVRRAAARPTVKASEKASEKGSAKMTAKRVARKSTTG